MFKTERIKRQKKNMPDTEINAINEILNRPEMNCLNPLYPQHIG